MSTQIQYLIPELTALQLFHLGAELHSIEAEVFINDVSFGWQYTRCCPSCDELFIASEESQFFCDDCYDGVVESLLNDEDLPF